MNRQRPVLLGIATFCASLSIGICTPALAGQQPPPPQTSRPHGGTTAGQPMSPGQTTQKTQESASAASHFAMEAADGGMAEVALGKLAASHGSNDAVKQFGQRMVEDHGKAGDELKSLAQQKGWNLPSQPSAKHQATEKKLEKLQGEAFDRAYMSDMLKDHRHDVAAFEKEANSGKDPELKAWAAKTLPTLKEHLKLAEQTASKVGVKGAAPKTDQ